MSRDFDALLPHSYLKIILCRSSASPGITNRHASQHATSQAHPPALSLRQSHVAACCYNPVIGGLFIFKMSICTGIAPTDRMRLRMLCRSGDRSISSLQRCTHSSQVLGRCLGATSTPSRHTISYPILTLSLALKRDSGITAVASPAASETVGSTIDGGTTAAAPNDNDDTSRRKVRSSGKAGASAASNVTDIGKRSFSSVSSTAISEDDCSAPCPEDHAQDASLHPLEESSSSANGASTPVRHIIIGIDPDTKGAVAVLSLSTASVHSEEASALDSATGSHATQSQPLAAASSNDAGEPSSTATADPANSSDGSGSSGCIPQPDITVQLYDMPMTSIELKGKRKSKPVIRRRLDVAGILALVETAKGDSRSEHVKLQVCPALA